MPDEPHDPGFLPLQWPLKLRPRVDFDPRSFLEVLANLGQRVLWEAVSRCPCGAAGGHGSSVVCPVCNGTGWEIGHHKQVVRAIVVGLRRDQQTYAPIGPFEPGTVSMTVRPEHAPAFWDRMTLLDATIRFSEILTRTPGRFQRPRYFIATQQVVTVQDGQEQTVTLRVIHARRGGVQRAGPVLTEGEDFAVTEEGLIDWEPGDQRGTAPQPGEQFSLYYVGRPSFRVVSYPHAVRDTRRRSKAPTDSPLYLPVNFLCRLEHLQLEPP